MQVIKEYIKNNKKFIVVIIIGFLLLLIQMSQVVLYADDFSLANIHKDSNIFQYFMTHYQTWGGGYTGCIVMILLDVSFGIWKVLNTLVITIIVILGTKMATYKCKKNNWIIAILIWACIFLLSIYTSRECIYWLDGSVAYVLSTFEMFIFIYLIYSKLIMKNSIKKYDYVLLPICALFSGWSSAQTGIMTLVITAIIILWAKFKQKDKIKPIIWISIIICLIGCLIFYLSPGNSARMEEFSEYSTLNIFEKITYRVEDIYSLMFDFIQYQSTGMPFYTILALRCFFNYRNTNNKRRKK